MELVVEYGAERPVWVLALSVLVDRVLTPRAVRVRGRERRGPRAGWIETQIIISNHNM